MLARAGESGFVGRMKMRQRTKILRHESARRSRFGAGGSEWLLGFLGLGDGQFATGLDYPAGVAPVGVALGDLNGDGWLDVVTANRDSNGFGILWNRGIVCGVK
jgi:hypothetical protein